MRARWRQQFAAAPRSRRRLLIGASKRQGRCLQFNQRACDHTICSARLAPKSWSPLVSFAMQSSFADFRPWPRSFPNWPDPCMRRCGGLGVTKRGELRLLEPRIPGTGALFFCEQPPGMTANVRRQDGEHAGQPLQDRNGKTRRRPWCAASHPQLRVTGPPPNERRHPFR